MEKKKQARGTRTCNPKSQTADRKTQTAKHKPQTINSKTQTAHHNTQTLNPEPKTGMWGEDLQEEESLHSTCITHYQPRYRALLVSVSRMTSLGIPHY